MGDSGGVSFFVWADLVSGKWVERYQAASPLPLLEVRCPT